MISNFKLAKSKFIFYIISIVILLFILSTSFLGLKSYISAKQEQIIINNEDDIAIGEIISGYSVEQTFIVNQNDICGISLYFATYNRTNTCNIIINLINVKTAEILQSWNIDAQEINDNSYKLLKIENTKVLEKGEEYKVVIKSEGASDGNAITLWASSENYYSNGKLSINNVDQKGDLVFDLYAKNNPYQFIITYYGLLIILTILFFSIVGYLLIFKKSLPLEKCFLITMLFMGFLYMLVFPPFSAPDESKHYTTAYKNSSKILFKDSVNETGDLYIREGDSGIYSGHPSLDSYLQVYKNILLTEDNSNIVQESVPIFNISVWAHLPQSVGIALARLMNLNYTQLIYMGRFFNLLSYTMILYYSIKYIPFGKMVLFAISMLPMTLELVSSLSYDPVILSTTIFYIAYILYLTYDKKMIEKLDIALLAVLGIVLSPCKIIYFLVVFLCVILPKNKFINRKNYWISIILIPVTSVLSMFISNITNINSVSDNNSNNYLPWINEASYSLSFVIHHPLKVAEVFLNTINSKLDVYFSTMIGSSLGPLEISVPNLIIIAFFLVLLISNVKPKDDKYSISNNKKIVFFSIAIALSLLLLLALLLTWTPLSYNYIEGVQGRYFLPILPLFIFSIRNDVISLKKDISNYLIVILLILNCITLVIAFGEICYR